MKINVLINGSTCDNDLVIIRQTENRDRINPKDDFYFYLDTIAATMWSIIGKNIIGCSRDVGVV
jgi:hypothetical protein